MSTCYIACGTLLNVMWQPVWGVGGRGNLKQNGYMYMYTESLCCSPETITTLLIVYTPIQNKKLKKNIEEACSGEGKWKEMRIV